MKCKICSLESHFFAQGTILSKYTVSYYKCDHCGFMQTEEPYWLHEAYCSTITRSDIGLVDRNVRLAAATRSVISCFFDSTAEFIDYGGGYGLFVRLMRDRGFNFYRYDKFCENIFALGFEANPAQEHRYELLSAFEVFEHLTDPISEIGQMVRLSSNIFFTTELLPVDIPGLDEWSYYALDHGQHISFYSYKTLSFIAQKLNLNLYSDHAFIHLMTAKKLSSLPLRYLSARMKVYDFLRGLLGRKSLIPSDYKNLTGKELS
jgi:hypothetical protein